MGDCSGKVPAAQRRLFLCAKTVAALDRLEQQAAIRMAGLDDLVSCPFCPYAAECPPTEADKEFRCENLDCKIVSCRLCKRKSHIPKSCEEVAKAEGPSARHEIEEAMSAAVIRTCNKCE